MLPAWVRVALASIVVGEVCAAEDGSSCQVAAEVLFTPDQLAAYNAEGEGRTIYLSILGDVFDVTAGAQHYAKGQAYHHFAGADASRAFATG